eukprot:TRINITY_DN20343_c0_g1_i1.p1 TRINITY_DN20343_c0_g1~~TRINITY_DN20343_c0_g1_i1.p1  ORF type:complete len:158 (+),score=38.65 TRINITY_DN20343_c0_g1_i1:56-475(+)
MAAQPKQLCFGGALEAPPPRPAGLGVGERLSICGQWVIQRNGVWREADAQQLRRTQPAMTSATADAAVGAGPRAVRTRRQLPQVVRPPHRRQPANGAAAAQFRKGQRSGPSVAAASARHAASWSKRLEVDPRAYVAPLQ